MGLLKVRCEKRSCGEEVDIGSAAYAWVACPAFGKSSSVFACSKPHLESAVDERVVADPAKRVG